MSRGSRLKGALFSGIFVGVSTVPMPLGHSFLRSKSTGARSESTDTNVVCWVLEKPKTCRWLVFLFVWGFLCVFFFFFFFFFLLLLFFFFFTLPFFWGGGEGGGA